MLLQNPEAKQMHLTFSQQNISRRTKRRVYRSTIHTAVMY